MKQNVYEVEKNVEKIFRGGYTGFLNSSVKRLVESKLKKNSYNTFIPFEDAEKIILYSKEIPSVRLFKIECYKDDTLKHSSIMGSLFGLNITSEMFGDIVNFDGNFYVYLLDEISELVVSELRMVGNVPVTLKEVDSNFLDNFKSRVKHISLRMLVFALILFVLAHPFLPNDYSYQILLIYIGVFYLLKVSVFYIIYKYLD